MARIGRARPIRAIVWVPVSAGGDITINGNVGNAVAAGVTGQVGVAITVDGTVGNAVANGVTGLVSVDVTVSGVIGNAIANGITGLVAVDVTVNGVIGNAVANGVTGIVDLGGITVDGIVGDAVAAGVTAVVGLTMTVNGTVGNAVAAGITGSVSVIEPGVAVFYQGNLGWDAVRMRRRHELEGLREELTNLIDPPPPGEAPTPPAQATTPPTASKKLRAALEAVHRASHPTVSVQEEIYALRKAIRVAREESVARRIRRRKQQVQLLLM